ncbi:Serine/threonine-protein phosphatase 2A activator 1 [Tilletia horrida]|uniref:Serine/threonine-protein phosphatase 2A activator n=1 Tax=Tilletia horrida TaxID=155126 RepID=A0AAN6JUQ2_9BASI|nr:Serine/threonine-protein phosphatase 2A activator 1 [Tilletia horrida]KAK0570275.1 Serine/threonine-protein phosphatase 2A activator 1 [Tilletia horrida]
MDPASEQAAVLQLLPRIDTSHPSVLSAISAPVKRIFTDQDLAAFAGSEAHSIYSLFVARLADASIAQPILPLDRGGSDSATSRGFQQILNLFAELDRWTAGIPREGGPQRFGNIAFRKWGQRLEEEAVALHKRLLPEHLHPFITELCSPFLASFGNFARIDYGSGHELSFALWICYLYRLNFFGAYHDAQDQQEERVSEAQRHQRLEKQLALQILPRYLRTVYALQDQYSLEPAGSHGVWGLDDFHFLPYIIGAAQLSSQDRFRPRDVLPNSGQQPPLPNLYSASIQRIMSLKSGGPFGEHSPMLTDIASSVPSWTKVMRGLLRMYEAEVLGKRVVIQLWDFGGVGWVWEGSSTSKPEHPANESKLAVQRDQQQAFAPTAAPWAAASSASTTVAGNGAQPSSFAPPTAAPWATATPSGMAGTSFITSSSSFNRPLGPRLGPSRAPAPSQGFSFGLPSSSHPTTLRNTGSAAAASSPFGSLARSSARPGNSGTGSQASPGLRNPLSD